MKLLSDTSRRLFSISFFCVLFAGFLNLSFAQNDALGEKTKFVPPAIIYNCDSGSLITNIGSLSGGDETLPGTTF
ncbi:MAG: hypothetical protein PHT32_07370, partial [Candidatus Omnitrophica bacterium]|nr:hypothetical protein [Candidatus Omnitrophota bacterium]